MLELQTIQFILNHKNMSSLLRRIKTSGDISLYCEILKLIKPFIKNNYVYYKDSNLLDNIQVNYGNYLNTIKDSISDQTFFSPSEVQEIIEKLIHSTFNSHLNWNILVDKKYMILSKRLIITVGDRIVTREKLFSLLYHELFVHLQRTVNSYTQNIYLETSEYIMFEEGLAKMMEKAVFQNITQNKSSYYPYIVVLHELGLNMKYILKISKILNYKQTRIEHLTKLLNNKKFSRFQPLRYPIGIQKVNYFSLCHNRSKLFDPILNSAMDKIISILFKYKFDPLNIVHINRLSNRNLLGFNKTETSKYKSFLQSKITLELNSLGAEINLQKFVLNRELALGQPIE